MPVNSLFCWWSTGSFTDGPFFVVWRAFLKGTDSPTRCDPSSQLQLAPARQQSRGVSPSERSLWVHLGKADVPARLLPALPAHSLGLEPWTDTCLLTPFIVTGLNVCDTYSESKITANTSEGPVGHGWCCCTWHALCLGECLVLSSWLEVSS